MGDTQERIRIVGICGSVRPGNFTRKALALVGQNVAARDHLVFDLNAHPIAQCAPGF